MPKRFVSIWFRHLKTDWFTRRQPGISNIPFVLAVPDHGRMMVSAANIPAQNQGIKTGLTVADARVIIPALQVLDDKPEIYAKLLEGIAGYCIRFTPAVSVDLPDGLILDVTGCAHLWGCEKKYLEAISGRLKNFGYDNRVAMADTIGTAWAIAHFGPPMSIIESGQQREALLSLPPVSLRLSPEIAERLVKLGLRQISQFIQMPHSALRRRFGQQIPDRLGQALGNKEEQLIPVHPIEPYQERLPCLEPIIYAKGVEIALKQLLDRVCLRLQTEQKGLRKAIFKCCRIDGKMEKIEIGTNRPSCNSEHLFKLFQINIETIEPAMGIELFMLEALKVEDLLTVQEKLWDINAGTDDIHLSELLDRIAVKIGSGNIQRYIPDEHYWPERSFKPASYINEKLKTDWKPGRPRPIQILPKPEAIEVTAPIPDYPPMLFRYKGILHKIIKADGPERIEPEWWLQTGLHRDYYCVEDEAGCRYWLFRLGHYDTAKTFQWFMHGFFA
jgi:protein ImuB